MPDFCVCRTQLQYPLHSLLGRCSGHRGHCLLAWQSILARKPRRHYPRRSKLFALDHRFIRASFGHGNSARQSGRFSTARLWAVELCIFGLLDRGHHGDHRCCLICLSGTGRKVIRALVHWPRVNRRLLCNSAGVRYSKSAQTIEIQWPDGSQLTQAFGMAVRDDRHLRLAHDFGDLTQLADGLNAPRPNWPRCPHRRSTAR